MNTLIPGGMLPLQNILFSIGCAFFNQYCNWNFVCISRGGKFLSPSPVNETLYSHVYIMCRSSYQFLKQLHVVLRAISNSYTFQQEESYHLSCTCSFNTCQRPNKCTICWQTFSACSSIKYIEDFVDTFVYFCATFLLFSFYLII